MNVNISTYDFLNKFSLGLVFIGVSFLSYINNIAGLVRYMEFLNSNAVLTTIISFIVLALIYEVGIIINRLGSLLECFLRFTHMIPFDNDYKKFNVCKKDYKILEILSREYALSRNSIVLFLLITIIIFHRFAWYGLFPLGIMFLFYISCYRYARKICDLME